MREALRRAGAGAALPPAFLALLAAGVPSPTAAALCCAAALLPSALGRPRAAPYALLAAAAGILVSALLLLPAAGVGGAAALAAAVACCGLTPRLSAARAEVRGSPAEGAAAAFAAVGLWRCAAFLLGHSLYAACVIAAALACGLALGRLARPRAQELRAWLSGLGPMLAGLLGLLLLHWLRVTGLNEAEPARVRAAVLGWGDALRLCVQLGLGTAVFAAALGAMEEDAPEASRSAWLAAPLAPLAGALLLSSLGPDGAAAAGFFWLCALGAWRGLSRWRAHPILSRAVPVLLAAAAALAFGARGSLRDVVSSRLQSVYPGGNLLVWSEARGEALGVYGFATGLRAVLRDGVADFGGGDPALLEAHLPLLAHKAGTVLFVDVLHAEAAAAALAHDAQASFYAPSPACGAVLEESLEGAPRPPSTATATCGWLRPPSGPFDAVVVHVDAPLTAPERALLLTREAAKAGRRRLTPGGLLAWRLPAAASSPAAQRAQAALQAEFRDVAFAEFGGGTLLMASDALEFNPQIAILRVTDAAETQLPGLRAKLAAGVPWTRAAASPLPATSAARPLGALPARLRR